MKRKLAILMIIAITLSITIHTDSKATSVFPADDGTHYYFGNHFDFSTWNSDDILTNTNYNTANEFPGDLSDYTAKTFYNIYGQYTDQKLYNTLLNNYIVESNKLDINNTYFQPIVVNGDTIPIEDCLKVCGITTGNNKLFNILLYCPNGDPISFGTGYRRGFMCTSTFYMSCVEFPHNLYTDTQENIEIFEFSSASNNYQITSSSQPQQGFPSNAQACRCDDFGGIFYSDAVVLFQAYDNNPTYGENSTYRYDLMSNYGGAWIDGTDTTGFVVDRRIPNFISKVENNQNQGTLGMLSGSYNQLFGGSSFNECVLMTLFQLNHYADNNRYNVYLNYNYTFDVSGVYNRLPLDYHSDYYTLNNRYDSYLVGSANFLAIDMDQAFTKMDIYKGSHNSSVNQIDDIRNSYSDKRPTYLNDTYNPIRVMDILSNAGLQSYTKYDTTRTGTIEVDMGNEFLNVANNIIQDLRSYLFSKPYDTYISEQSGISNYTSYCKLTVTTFLSMGDQTSSSVVYVYDFLTGEWSSTGDISFDDGDAFNGYDYNNPIQDVGNNNNGIPTQDFYTYGGSSSASIGDITINVGSQAALTIVDLSSEEWLMHSPTFNELITTVKTGLTSVAEGSQSVASLLATQYAVFPVAIWGYLGLSIAIISALSIVRYIRRG